MQTWFIGNVLLKMSHFLEPFTKEKPSQTAFTTSNEYSQVLLIRGS
jgi:hypothetical protein